MSSAISMPMSMYLKFIDTINVTEIQIYIEKGINVISIFISSLKICIVSVNAKIFTILYIYIYIYVYMYIYNRYNQSFKHHDESTIIVFVYL